MEQKRFREKDDDAQNLFCVIFIHHKQNCVTGEKENRTKTKQKTTKHHMERTQNKGKGNDVTKYLVFYFIIT